MLSLNALAIPESIRAKPEALKMGEYYRIGNVHENRIWMRDCQACSVLEGVCIYLSVYTHNQADYEKIESARRESECCLQ